MHTLRLATRALHSSATTLRPSGGLLSMGSSRLLLGPSSKPSGSSSSATGSGIPVNVTGQRKTGFSVKDSDVWQNRRHEWRTHRTYQGQVKAVVLDWAGTVLDSGVYRSATQREGQRSGEWTGGTLLSSCCRLIEMHLLVPGAFSDPISPAVVFIDVFAKFGVPISMEEARGPSVDTRGLTCTRASSISRIEVSRVSHSVSSCRYHSFLSFPFPSRRMGAHKRVHIRKITQNPAVRERWKAKHGRFPNEDDVEAMFKDFVPMQLAVLPKYTGMISGAVETVNELQKVRGLKIGSTTGFTTPMVDILKKAASEQGYTPDCYVAADEVPQVSRDWRGGDRLGRGKPAARSLASAVSLTRCAPLALLVLLRPAPSPSWCGSTPSASTCRPSQPSSRSEARETGPQ
jgi:beta-phosphoglucomutase-like phosphatase (HAD superfamily)